MEIVLVISPWSEPQLVRRGRKRGNQGNKFPSKVMYHIILLHSFSHLLFFSFALLPWASTPQTKCQLFNPCLGFHSHWSPTLVSVTDRFYYYKKYSNWALAGVAQWIECRLRTKGLPVQFPVRAYAWVAGQVPIRQCERQPHIDVSPPLFLPPFPPL